MDALSRAEPCTVRLSTHIITDLERIAEHVDRVRVNVFPLGLEDIFVSLFGPESRGEFSGESP